ncbi:MAG: 50S ribosomal protein L29 [Deltaproteobacteria bacterium]|nr:MAG: 50S ribosomal protein L29 [Deltaproteobacteria bacterium]
MKAREYRERTLEELQQTAQDLQQDLFNLRFQHATGQLDNVTRLTAAKRDLARVKTIIREHQLGIRRVAGEQAAGQAETAEKA